MPDRDAGDRTFETRWVHVAERDTPEGQVFVPETSAVPLSRRPRARLEIRPDGTATLYEPGPDDRPRPRPVTWTDAAATRGTADLRIVSREPDRLVVERAAPREDR